MTRLLLPNVESPQGRSKRNSHPEPMNPIQKIKDKGVRGSFAAGFRRLAKALEPGQSHRGAESGAQDRTALPVVWSDYLERINYAIPGWLARGNIDAMSFAIENLPGDAPIVEIGSFCGLSTCVLTHLKERLGVKNRLITCDPWNPEERRLESFVSGSRSITHREFHTYCRDSFLRNARLFCKADLPYTIEESSDNFFARWSTNSAATDVFGRPISLGGSIGFCYIDGNHSYEFARRDFDNADRFLALGGFILLDDSSDGKVWEGVNRLAKEVAHSEMYVLVNRSPNYLFRKR